jgi:hypothetical protein
MGRSDWGRRLPHLRRRSLVWWISTVGVALVPGLHLSCRARTGISTACGHFTHLRRGGAERVHSRQSSYRRNQRQL